MPFSRGEDERGLRTSRQMKISMISMRLQICSLVESAKINGIDPKSLEIRRFTSSFAGGLGPAWRSAPAQASYRFTIAPVLIEAFSTGKLPGRRGSTRASAASRFAAAHFRERSVFRAAELSHRPVVVGKARAAPQARRFRSCLSRIARIKPAKSLTAYFPGWSSSRRRSPCLWRSSSRGDTGPPLSRPDRPRVQHGTRR